MVLRCRPTGGAASMRSLVVKAIGLPEVTRHGLICELLGNLLARELGVVTAPSAIVDIDPDAADAINGGLVREGLASRPGLAVGCNYLRPLLPVIGALPEQVEPDVPRLFGFDLAVQNPDRRSDNPNCALYENRLLAYDFEMSFSFLMQVLGLIENLPELERELQECVA